MEARMIKLKSSLLRSIEHEEAKVITYLQQYTLRWSSSELFVAYVGAGSFDLVRLPCRFLLTRRSSLQLK